MHVSFNAAVLAGIVGVVGVMSTANATTISPVSAVASSTYSDIFDGPRGAGRTIDGSGLNLISGLASTDFHTMWLGDRVGAEQSITFDLGSVVSITAARVWNYNETGYTNLGVMSGSIQVSVDNITYTTLGALNLLEAPGIDTSDFSQVVTINAVAQYVRFADLQSFASSVDRENLFDSAYVGLSELNVEVPEPASLALLGFGLVGLVASRKRVNAAA